MDLAVIAGTISTVLFAISNMPMLIKAVGTRDMASYSVGNLALSNVGNAVHSIYVYSLPVGPIWVLHSFYVVAAALMLIWYLRFGRSRPACPAPADPGHHGAEPDHPAAAPAGGAAIPLGAAAPAGGATDAEALAQSN